MAEPQPPPPPPAPPQAQVVPGKPVETLSRRFLGISVRRAYRLEIRNEEVLPAEREMLESQASHIRLPEHQAFLAWRRSVLLLVAIMFVPLTISRFLETWDGPPVPPIARAFMLLPSLAEAGFCLVAFDQLRYWTQWKRQRRTLFIAWCVYFIAPFLFYLYPYRYAYASVIEAKAVAKFGDISFLSHSNFRLAVGLVVGVRALIALGPKVISLMPGLIRASIVTKLLFPGSTVPGWLMMAAAPLYALFAYIIVILPYQVTGSWQFLVGNAGIMGAQIFIGSAGRRLTVPLTQAESHDRVHKSWLWYIGILVVSAGFMVYGLYVFFGEIHLGMVQLITSILAVVSNVLLDTLVGVDLIVAAMAHFRKRDVPDPAHLELLRESEAKLDTFTA